MRPNRTLPPALSLAVVAAFPLALLSGCVESELEPGYEPPEATGPELLEGVSVGPDGVIVIERGLLAGGIVLDEEDWEDLAQMRNYICYDLRHCFHVCPAHARKCVCKFTSRGHVPAFECKVIYFGDDPCDGEWGGLLDCEGEGEGGGRESELSLECTPRVERGGTAKCTLSTGSLDPNTLTYEWVSKFHRTDAHVGQLGLVWQGTATETLDEVGVIVTPPQGESETLKRTITVDPRRWKLGKRGARLEYVDKIPGVPNVGAGSAWGRYAEGALINNLLVGQGTGPWEGSYYVSTLPRWIGEAAMYAHNDLKSGGPEYPIPAADTICGLSGVSRGVYSLNKKCGWQKRVDAFRLYVAAHEHGHQNSLNKCIEAVNTDGRLAAVEGIVKPDSEQAKREALNLWTNGVRAALVKSVETNQKGHSTDFAHWRRFERWAQGGKTGDHGGTDGCPR